MPSSTLLLIEADPAAGEVVTGVLTNVGYSVTTVGDADDVFEKGAAFHLLILDVIEGSRSAIELCREIRATPALAAIPVLCITPTDDVEERIRFLEAGSDDVIARPFDGRELEARVEALLLRFQRSRDLAPLVSGNGQVGRPRTTAACFSPKGGVGTTTIAVNMASAIATKRPDQVLIIDLALQFGQVATHLNVKARQTIVDLCRDEQALREPELLRSYAARDERGLWVLASAGSPELAELVTAAHVERLIATAAEAFDAVVIDAGSSLDERALGVLEQVDAVVLSVYPEIAALKALHSLLDYLNENGSVSAKSTFVLNQVFARELLKISQVESSLGVRMSAELPYDPFVFLKAVNEGVPVVRGAPRTLPAERLIKLTTTVFGEAMLAPPLPPAPAKTAPSPDERRSRLGGLLRRS